MLVERAKKPWLSDDIMGRCVKCHELVSVVEWNAGTHPCSPCEVSYSLQAIVNPDNTPWVPGYAFWMAQAAGTATGHRSRGNSKPRTYHVHFQIDMDGKLQHVGGPKPTPATFARFEEQYAREKPGSNWYPGADDEA